MEGSLTIALKQLIMINVHKNTTKLTKILKHHSHQMEEGEAACLNVGRKGRLLNHSPRHIAAGETPGGIFLKIEICMCKKSSLLGTLVTEVTLA
jgi:hypothetical protein